MERTTLGIKTLIHYIIQRTIVSLFILFLVLQLPNITQFAIIHLNLSIDPGSYAMINRVGNLLMASLFLLFSFVIFIGVISSILKYLGTTYTLDDYAFKFTKGIFSKNEISIPYKHIENVDVRQSIMFRLLGLSRLAIFSAGNPDKEGDMTDQIFDVIDSEKAEYLKNYLLKKAEIEEVVQVKE